MNTFDTAVLSRFAADLAQRRPDRFAHLVSEGVISPAAAAFARQLGAVSLFFEALRVGNASKLYDAL